MQHEHHDRADDLQLRGMLREWQVPGASASLERRVLGSLARERAPWWRFLLSGSIRVPIPVLCGLAMLLTGAVWRFAVRAPQPCTVAMASAPAARVQNAQAALPSRCGTSGPGVC